MRVRPYLGQGDVELLGRGDIFEVSSRMRVKAVLYALMGLFIGFFSISVIPRYFEQVSPEVLTAGLDSAEGVKRAGEPPTAAFQPSADGSGWASLIGLWSMGLLLSLAIYLLARACARG